MKSSDISDERRISQFFIKKKDKAKIAGNRKIWRIEAPFRKMNILDWLQQHPHSLKIYWCNRNRDFEMAGIGVVDEITGDEFISYSDLLQRINSKLSASHPSVRYYGGVRFNPFTAQANKWKTFSVFRFVVPQFEIFHDKDKEETRLVLNFIWPPNGNHHYLMKRFRTAIDQFLRTDSKDKVESPLVQKRRNTPTETIWKKNIRSVSKFLDNGELQKIVLARQSQYQFSPKWNAVFLLKQLIVNNPKAFYFYFQPAHGTSFMGATPERLYYRKNRDIYSEAMAGTKPRGKNLHDDEEIGDKLLTSDKDIREHRWVSHRVENSLRKICCSLEELNVETLLKLTHVQHIYTQFRGKLKDNISNGDILTELHPTPAVGGHPREFALQKIDELEPFDRGWYAGPVGWVGKDTEEFAVAIRSALISDDAVFLFAGAGIVQGSDPHEEWQEMENKILNFTKIFETT